MKNNCFEYFRDEGHTRVVYMSSENTIDNSSDTCQTLNYVVYTLIKPYDLTTQIFREEGTVESEEQKEVEEFLLNL